MVQVLVRAATVSPAPRAAAIHFRPGTNTEARMLASTMVPVTRRT